MDISYNYSRISNFNAIGFFGHDSCQIAKDSSNTVLGDDPLFQQVISKLLYVRFALRVE